MTDRNLPSERCHHCGKELTAETRSDLEYKYSQHVIGEHDKPGSAEVDVRV